MKDVSEHIVDLAYSALVFDSLEMKEEVDTLEEKMDEYLYLIRMNCMLAARSTEDAEQLSGILQVASAAEGISDAASDIASIVGSKSKYRLLLPMVLKDADESIQRIRITSDSCMVSKKIGKLKVEEITGTRIIAIKRRFVWRYDIDGDVRLLEDDILFVRGVKDGIDELRLYAEKGAEWDSYRREVSS